MKKKFFLSIVFVLIFTLGLAASGCGWIGVLDTNPSDDEPPGNEEYRKFKVAEIRRNLLGKDADYVKQILGEPEWKNELGSYRLVDKFRGNQIVFNGKEKRKMSECGPIYSDVSWTYSWSRRTSSYYSEYGYIVFFKDGIVVSVE